MTDYENDSIFDSDELTTVEYKKSFSSLSNSAFESYSAFANASGGTIVLGVDQRKDSHGSTLFVPRGVDDAQTQVEEFIRKLNDPQFTNGEDCLDDIKIIHNTHTDKKLIIIKVKKSPKKLIYVKSQKFGKIKIPFIRKGSEDFKLDGEELTSIILNNKDELDTDILKNVTIADLNIKTINAYRRKIEENSRLISSEEDTETFLRHIGAITKDYEGDGQEGVTVAGLLFFGLMPAIMHYFPHYQLDLYDYRSKDKTHRWTNRISTTDDLNLFDFFMESHSYLQSTTSNEFGLSEDLSRDERTFKQLKIALREALINTIMHANYFEKQRTIIGIYWDYYTFENPGKMKIDTKEFFTTTKSIARNNVISKFMIHIGFGERSGTGGEQIGAVAKDDALRMPEIETDNTSTSLKIWTVDLVKTIPDISDTARSVLQLLFKESKPISKPNIADRLNISQHYAQEALNELTSRSIVKKTGQRKGTKYSYRRSISQEIVSIKQQAGELQFPN